MANDVTTKILEVQVNYGDALTKIAQYRIELDKIKDKQKELKEQLKQGQITQEEYHKSMESSKQVMSQYSNAVSVLSKQISNQLKVEKEQDGSLVQLRAKLSNLTAEYDRLSKAEREGAKGSELKEKMNQLTTEIKGLEEATQRYYRNVGNYPKTMSSLGDQLEMYVIKLREMTAAHQEGTPEFEAMAKKAETLRETLATASDEGGSKMNDLGEKVVDLGLGFNAWTDILDKAGLKNKEVEQTLSQMMIVITAAGTALKVYNAFQKESALYVTALQVKTMLLNTTLGKYIASRVATTAAEAAGTTATGAASTATKIFNAVLYANPLVWLIGIIVAAVAAIYGLVKAFQWFTSSSEEQKKALEAEAKAIESLKTQLEETRAMMEAYGKTSEEIARQSIIDAQKIHNEWYKHFEKIKQCYDEDDDEYKAALESKATAWSDFQKSMTDGLVLLRKAQTESREKEREAALGEYEYKRTLIHEQTQQQIALAKTLLRFNKITKEEYNTLVADLKKLETSKISEVNTSEADAAKKRQEEEKKRQEEEKKRQEDYEKEFQAAQDALVNILKDGLDKQLKVENLSYERSMKALTDKLAKYKTQSEYDIKMRQEIQTQIEALTYAHEQRVSQFQFAEAERRIKVEQELLQSKLEIVKKGTEEEMQLRIEALEIEKELEKRSIEQRVADGLLTKEQGDLLLLNMEASYQQKKVAINEEYQQLEYDRQRAELENKIANMDYEHSELELRRMTGFQMEEQQYQKWREQGLNQMDEYTRNKLLMEEQAAQLNLDNIIAQGQLQFETQEEFNARVIAARQEVVEATKNTNAQIIANEQAKAQAMKAVVGGLTSLLDTLGESNETFAKMSKMITLAQIAIDTGKALSSGIASASGVPFPGNIAAIATTVATILANVATAISTVKSAKFAQGGKVIGPGTGTSDDVPAYLSNGEFVMTAAATRLFEPLLMTMNNIGKGVPMQVVNSYREVETSETLTNSFESAAKEIRPIVSVVEITETQNRLEMIQNLDNF